MFVGDCSNKNINECKMFECVCGSKGVESSNYKIPCWHKEELEFI